MSADMGWHFGIYMSADMDGVAFWYIYVSRYGVATICILDKMADPFGPRVPDILSSSFKK